MKNFVSKGFTNSYQKLMLIMKLTFTLIVFFTLTVSAKTFSQEEKINLDIKNKSIREVLKTIENQTSFRFFFNDEFTDLNREVSVYSQDESISQILAKVFKQTDVTYVVMNNNFVVITPAGLQQEHRVSGRVTDRSTGDPLPGVNIVIKGTTLGVISDIDGKFSLNVPNSDAVLVFSFVGFETTEVPLEGRTQIEVSLNPQVTSLDEIIVVGYGTQRRGDVTSAISSVKSDEFIEGAVKDAGQLIQGKVAGLTITNPSGDPLAGVQIMLRGNSTLNASTAPLVIVDGIPGDLNLVAPQDIESIDVLKDGSAASIYGTRGNNGVIIVTTKKARKNQGLNAEYSTYVSTQTISKNAEFLTADDYIRLINEGITLDNVGYKTDWLSEITRVPVSQMHNVSVSGGTETTTYIGSFNYTSTQGIFLKSDVAKMTSRIDVTHSMFKDKLTINVGLLTGVAGYNTVDKTYAYRQALIHNPTEPVRNQDGTWYENPSKFQYENPVALLKEADGDNKDRYNRIYGSITLTPLTGLRFKVLGSRNVWNQTSGYYETLNHISNIRDNQGGYASRGAGSSEDNLLEITTEYSHAWKEHSITGLAGYSYQDNLYEYLSMSNKDFPTDVFGYNNIGLGYGLTDGVANMASGKTMSKLIGFFGRINYNYKQKYLLQVSLRREGSSKFGKHNKWGSFPAVQGGWRISQESFLNNVSWINDLKLRAGYGVTGIEPYDSYLSLTLLSYSSFILVDGKWQQTIVPSSNPNPDLRWEKKLETNLGLDFSLFNDRISGSVDLYQRNTDDLLWNYSVPTPPYLYGSILANVGKMENKGLEVLVNFVPIKTDDFSWTSSINYSTNSNKLVSLSNDLFQYDNDYIDAGYTGDPIQTNTHRIFIGKSIGDFWGYKSVDIDENGEWLIQTPAGDTIPYSAVAPEDKQVLGNGLPKFYMGWNNSLQYKNFDLSITMRGAFGFQILNFQRMYYENPTITYNMLKSAYDKVYGKSLLNSPQAYVSYYIENGDYWKIDNVTLGYNLPVKKNKYISSCRIYASGLNLLTITKYKGIDPEVNRNGWDPGNDNRDKYPTTRTFSLGLTVKF